MMLGARTGAWAKSGGEWTNPYITDGLVAMWDGEWNVGGGLPHDSKSKVWVDCIGGGGSIPITANYSWDEKALVHNSAGNIIFCENDISEFVQVEFVCEITNVVNGEYFGIGNESVKSAGIVYWNTGVGISRRGNNRTGFPKTIFSSASVSAMSALNVTSAYINGVETTATLGSASSWSNHYYLRWSIGGNKYPPETQFRLKCVRIYNRALTASEIAANYAVDKARFNLT